MNLQCIIEKLGKLLLLGGDELNDKLINAAQKMLINQFPSL